MGNQIKIYNIKINEVKPSAIVLSHAFKNDPLIRWIFNDENLYEDKSVALFETWVKYCVLYGKAFRTNDFESIALRKNPGDSKLTFWRILRSGMLLTPKLLGKEAFQRLMQFDELSTQEKIKNMDQRLFWYCWILGTDPRHENKGYATCLVNHTFAMAKQDSLPCYLETANETSKKFHINKGFKLLSTFALPNSDINIYAMLKETVVP